MKTTPLQQIYNVLPTFLVPHPPPSRPLHLLVNESYKTLISHIFDAWQVAILL